MRISVEAPIVLGSASPRRRELLTMARVPFIVRPASADETAGLDENGGAYLERVVLAKLDAVRAAWASAGGDAGGRPVLVADTIVVAPTGTVLGKPRDDEDGRRMIEALAGATHAVQTRFLLADLGPDRAPAHAQTVTTAVTFRRLGAGEAARYVATGEGRDKAGGYAVQGAAGAFVERIEGSYTSVVGLPLCEVVVALRKLGWFAE